MAFPETPLPTRVDLHIDGERTDITEDMYHRDQMKVTRGRRDWGSNAEQSKLTGQINNRSGTYSFRNPHSPYYGVLRRNTQIQVSLPADASYLRLPGDAGAQLTTPDAAALGITGDIDIRLEATLDAWHAPVDLIGKWDSSSQRSWTLQINSQGLLALTWTTDGTGLTWHQVISTAPVDAGLGDRLAVRCTLDVDDGGGGHVVTFYTAGSLSGPWVQLGDAYEGSGTTSIHDGTAALEIGDVLDSEGVPTETGGVTAEGEPTQPASGRIHAAELRSGIGGTVVADPNLEGQTAGDDSFADTASSPNTWTVAGGAAIDDREYRFTGEVASWKQRWDVDGEDVWVPIEAAGVLRRLTTGASTLQSPMRRSLVKLAATQPAAYWPCEDASGATVLASGLPSGQPMRITGSPQLAASDTFDCSEPLPVVNNSRWTGTVPPYTDPDGASRLQLLLSIPDEGLTDGAVIARITTTGTAPRFDLVYTTDFDGSLDVHAYDAEGTLLDSAGTIFLDGTKMIVGIELRPNQAGEEFAMIRREVGSPSSGGFLGDLDGRTPGYIKTVTIDPTGNVGDAVIGHVAVVPGEANWIASDELDGHVGEGAGARFLRLCAEEGISARLVGASAGTPTMGPQRPLKLVDLLNEVAETDGGFIFEPTDMLGLGYRTRDTLYNQPPLLSLSYTTDGEVAPDLEPDDDDQSPGNDVTASRPGGSSARVQQDEGPNAVDTIGQYEQSITANIEDDRHLVHYAGWRVHLNTVDEARYPVVRVDLAAAPHLQPEVLRADSGSLIEIADLPSHLPPEPVRLMVQGYTEKIGQYDWDIWYNCSPGGAWTVGLVEDPELGRVDTDGSELAADADTDDTTLSVAVTAGPVWVLGAPALNPNPRATDALAGTWFGNNATIARAATPGVVPVTDGASSIEITPNGSSASGGVNSELTGVGTITPGALYTVSCWAYSPGGWADLRAAVDWHDSAGTYLSSGLGTGTSVPAATWTFLQQTVTAPASASQAQARARHGTTPSSSDVWYVTQLTIRPATTGEQLAEFPFEIRLGGEVVRVEAITGASSPQTHTVVRAINGVTKDHAAGTDVRLAHPLILAL